MLKKIISLPSLSVLAVAAMLTACGGGGGGDSSSGTGSGTGGSGGVVAPVEPSVPVVTNPSTIVTDVPVANYAALSENLAAYDRLNNERQSCGFGKLAQNAKLDAAALAHADWSLINNYFSHYESSSVPLGFTGVTAMDRATAAGYSGQSVGENLAGGTGSTSIVGYGEIYTRSLMSTPYHLFGMMSPHKDVGLTIRSRDSVTPFVNNGLAKIAVFNFGVATGDTFQTVDDATVLTYPCEGSTGIAIGFTGEDPNPVPGRDLVANPLGHALLVMVKKGQTLVISSASLTNISTGAAVALRAPVTAANDVNNVLSVSGTYMGFVLPDAPLAVNTQYQATMTGTNDGKAFSRTYKFTTGSRAL